MPQISVIVPVYNTEQFLHRCVDSILTQSYGDFELLLVNDGSTDQSGTICDEYALIDSRVKVFHQANHGQAAARNYALDWVFSNSGSTYIAFVDSDDWIHSRFLELLLLGFEEHDVGMCQCSHLKTDGSDSIPSDVTVVYSYVSPEEQYIYHYSPYIWEKLYKRDVWKDFRFPEGQIFEDLAMWYKLLFSQEKLAVTDTALYYYFSNPESTVHQEWRPSRMARMNAWDDQLSFFSGHSREMVDTVVEHYSTVCKEEFYLIGDSSKLSKSEKAEFQNSIADRIKILTKEYRKPLKKSSNYLWSLEIMHPFFSKCRWKLKGLLKRLQMKGGKDVD